MFLLWILFLDESLFSGGVNVTSEIYGINYTPACRTERKIYLMFDHYKLDTCAKCYFYMPPAYFKRKFLYDNWIGMLKDPDTNSTYEANPMNASKELLTTFKERSLEKNWKDCCFAAEDCCIRMLQTPPFDGEGLICPRTWDGWQCWDDTAAGSTAQQHCQPHIYFQAEPPDCKKWSYKECTQNGTWFARETGQEWSNYTRCSRVDDHQRYLYFHIATYAISVVSIVPSLIIFSVYKQLQVHRITMHKNLFLSLFLNGVVVLLFKCIVVLDEFNRTKTYRSVMQRNGNACKVLLVLTKYFRISNFTWMFCEGYYLHKLIAAAFAEQKSLTMFYIIGWLVPVIPVTIYAIIRKTLDDESCWAFPVDPYEWIMNAPNMASLALNLIFLCNIIRVLVTKLRATHSNEPSQYRKAVRATLVLIPLFGLQFCFIIYRPQSGHCLLLEAYTYFSHAMDGLQGFMVSVIFCYMNGEVLFLIRRSYHRYRLSHNFGGRFQNSIMLNPGSFTQDSTMGESHITSQHGLHYRTRPSDKQLDEITNITKSKSFQELTTTV